jgi:sarcosine oxidase
VAYDVIVIGAGVMGSATAYAVARTGRQVLLLEQFELGHTQGSSHGRARIFRFSYPDPLYVGMAMEARELWRALERDVVRPGELLIERGGLDVGDEIAANAAALTEHGARFEMLSAADVARKYPSLRMPPDVEVLYQPDGGVVAADAAIKSFVSGARNVGAEVRERTKVVSLEATSDAVIVGLGDEELSAEAVVVAAGAWVRGLMEPLGIEVPVRPTRETVAFYRTSDDIGPTLVEWGDPSVYSLPSLTPNTIKVGEHIAGPDTDPDEPGPPNAGSVARLSAWMAERYPTADPEPVYTETCLYTNTDDQRFILERHGRVIVGSPCSGHGFKFAPLIGRRLAALAEEVL